MKALRKLIALLVLGTLAMTATGQDTTAAQEAAGAWLETFDGGANVGATWDSAASMFRNAITRERWVQAAQSVRGPLGGVTSRSLKASTPSTSLPGAPDGQYVVIQYATAFANKADSTETVTVALDMDGQWRVAGYFVR